MTTHPITLEMLAQGVGVLGKVNSGKTYAVKGAVEQMLRIDRRVCVIDPTSAWWGLGLDARGNTGFPVTIFGGRYGHVEIEPHHGDAVGRLVATRQMASVIDLKNLSVSGRARFFTAFGEALLSHVAAPLHLVIDECHNFMPQSGGRGSLESNKLLHVANELITGGRLAGIRPVLLSQRAAKVHKDSLNQIETLVAMRVIAPLDRKSVKDWIAECADPEVGKEIVASLPTLKRGEGWVWSPELEVLKRVKFPPISTWDSSRSPDEMSTHGHAAAPRPLGPAGIEEIKAALASAPGVGGAPVPNIDVAESVMALARQSGYRDGYRDGYTAALAGVADAVTSLGNATMAPASLGAIVASLKRGNGHTVAAAPHQLDPDGADRRDRARTTKAPTRPVNGLHGAARAILTVLLQVNRELTWTEISIRAVISQRSGYWNAGVAQCREHGWISETDVVKITDDGVRKLDAFAGKPAPGVDILKAWATKLPGCAPKILDALYQTKAQPASWEYIAQQCGISRRSGYWNAGLAKLRRNHLIEEPDRNTVRLTAVLW